MLRIKTNTWNKWFKNNSQSYIYIYLKFIKKQFKKKIDKMGGEEREWI